VITASLTRSTEERAGVVDEFAQHLAADLCRRIFLPRILARTSTMRAHPSPSTLRTDRLASLLRYLVERAADEPLRQ